MSRGLKLSHLYGNLPALTSEVADGQAGSRFGLAGLITDLAGGAGTYLFGFVIMLMMAVPARPALGQAPAVLKPELVLVVAIDQLRRDRALASLPGGIGRLLREGRVFVNAQLGHAISTTCPGHVTMLTGRFPGSIGVPDNAHLERGEWQQRYCVADPQSPVLGPGDLDAELPGRSPALIDATALGDWLQRQDPAAQVLSIGGKDRAVIALAGKRPTAAIWFDRDQGKFNTSRYYATELPQWVAPASLPSVLDALPQTWTHAPGDLRVDDFVGENDEFERTSGHPLGVGERGEVAEQFYASPWIDEAVLQLAERAISAEGLMTNQRTDLVALSLPATDVVGHYYGPFSAESADSLQRLDLGLGKLLQSLENQVGGHTEAGQLLVVLTSDHGVAALPEWLQQQNAQRCPVDDGRVSALSVLGGMLWHVYKEFSAPFGLPQRLVSLGGTMLYVTEDPELLGEHSHAEVVAELETYLESQPYVAQAWTASELVEQAPSNPIAQLYLNSYSAKHSGDLMLQLEPGCQLSDTGTTHGSPYAYDRDIPLVFFGSAIAAGADTQSAASVDIATTLADLLGLPTPDGLDGVVLPVTAPPK